MVYDNVFFVTEMHPIVLMLLGDKVESTSWCSMSYRSRIIHNDMYYAMRHHVIEFDGTIKRPPFWVNLCSRQFSWNVSYGLFSTFFWLDEAYVYYTHYIIIYISEFIPLSILL